MNKPKCNTSNNWSNDLGNTEWKEPITNQESHVKESANNGINKWN